MRSPLTAAAVCIALLAGAPAAQAAEQPVAAQTCTPQETVAKTAKGTPAVPVRGELIKTAAAGTRDEPPAMRSGPHAGADADEDRPKRGGTAMLLAALALMSGIALRRYGAPRS